MEIPSHKRSLDDFTNEVAFLDLKTPPPDKLPRLSKQPIEVVSLVDSDSEEDKDACVPKPISPPREFFFKEGTSFSNTSLQYINTTTTRYSHKTD